MLQRTLTLLGAELNPILGAQQGAPAPAAAAQAVANGTAVAAEGAAGGGMNMIWIYGVWVLVIVGFYFLTIRPQRKREKAVREMQAAIKVGDEVLTNGGMYGRIAELGDDCFVIEFGINRGIRIPVRKTEVLSVQSPRLTPPPPSRDD